MLKPDMTPRFSCKYSCDVPLARYTTWGVGGAAAFFAEPGTVDEFIELANFAKLSDTPLCVIGCGSNTLIRDTGFPGIVIYPRKSYAQLQYVPELNAFKVQAGCSMPSLAHAAAKNGIAGYEFLSCIPGTVGGGIVTNAGVGGSGGSSIADILVEVTVLNPASGKVTVCSPDDIDIGYRHSNILERGLIVLNAVFRCSEYNSSENILLKQRSMIEARKKKQPSERKTAGSVFKQAAAGKPAALYIDEAGLKGMSVGGAIVSTKHANWIVNDGSATATDICELIDIITNTVEKKFGVMLEREVKILPDDIIGQVKLQ